MPEIHPKMKEVKENKFALLPRSQARQGGRQVDRPLRIRNVFCNQDLLRSLWNLTGYLPRPAAIMERLLKGAWLTSEFYKNAHQQFS